MTDYSTCSGSTYTKMGKIQRRLAWPLCKDDTQICEEFHKKKKPTRLQRLGNKAKKKVCYEQVE